MNKKNLVIPIATSLITFIILFFVLLSLSNEDVKDSDASILFLGDFMIGDSYDGDASIPFENLKTLFEDKDDIIVNLETSIADDETPVFPDKTYTYNMKSTVLEKLVENNITILNMANNHILDYGVDGFNDTMRYLQNHGLSFFGAGLNETQARTGTIKTYKDSIDIGYLGYFEYWEIYDDSYHFYAKDNVPGIAKLNMTNLEEDISKMKESVDIVLVSLHIGKNYYINISDEAKNFARYAVDMGADAVIIHSPHISLPVEFYNGRPILYSIGNFIFTTPGRFYKVDEIYHTGIAAEFVIKDKKIASMVLTAFKTNNELTGYKPYILPQEESIELFETLIPNGVDYKFDDSSIVIDLTKIGG